jgi:hypothetical protein
MTNHRVRYGPAHPDETYVSHEIAEHLVDLGEIQMNYATVGDPSSPALLLIPGQSESWWQLRSERVVAPVVQVLERGERQGRVELAGYRKPARS